MHRNIFLSVSLIIFSIALVMSAKIISRSIDRASYNVQAGFSNLKLASINNSIEEKDIISTFEAAQLLGTTESTLIGMINDKRIDIPCTRVDRYYVFSKKAISKWLETSHSIK